MTSEEIKKELDMGYQELVSYLLEKYGPAKYDYFVNDLFKTKNNKVSRTKEGLYCHHMDEDKAIMLSSAEWARKNPFDYQKAERLVYCNALEHLILHVKIVEAPRAEGANLFEAHGVGGAVNFLCPQINDYYNGFEYKREFERNIFGVIKDNFEDYIKILRYFLGVLHDKHPEYLSLINERSLSRGFSGDIVEKVYERIK